jgi:hypothetical protein
MRDLSGAIRGEEVEIEMEFDCDLRVENYRAHRQCFLVWDGVRRHIEPAGLVSPTRVSAPAARADATRPAVPGAGDPLSDGSDSGNMRSRAFTGKARIA